MEGSSARIASVQLHERESRLTLGGDRAWNKRKATREMIAVLGQMEAFHKQREGIAAEHNSQRCGTYIENSSPRKKRWCLRGCDHEKNCPTNQYRSGQWIKESDPHKQRIVDRATRRHQTVTGGMQQATGGLVFNRGGGNPR